MKFICSRPQLYEIVSNVSRAVSGKSSLAVLEGILIRAKRDKLTFLGYDLDLGIYAEMPAKVEEEGEIVLSARLFVDMMRRMNGETVSIRTDDKYLTEIKSGLTEFTILGIPSDEFPEVPSVEEVSPIELPQHQLQSMIDQTLFAISQNDAKPVHTGSLFQLSEGELRVVSVDGFRLALRREKVAAQGENRFIIPGKTLAEISKLLSEDEEEPAKVFLSRKHVVVQIGQYKVISRLLDGDFLDYEAAIPPGASTTVEVGVREFINAIERTSLLISDRLKSPLRIRFEDDMIKMSCSTAIGKAYDEMECKMEGSAVEIGFNNRYVLEALRSSACDKVKLLISGPLSPMKMVPMEGEDFLFLILPVRLKSEA